jgi:hypothetical protein
MPCQEADSDDAADAGAYSETILICFKAATERLP